MRAPLVRRTTSGATGICASVTLGALLLSTVAFGQSQNMDAGLRELIARYGSATPIQHTPHLSMKKPPSGAISATGIAHVRVDGANRVLVDVLPDSIGSVEQLVKLISENSGIVVATNAGYRNGIVSAYVPIGSLEVISSLPGVRSVLAAHPPRKSAGLTMSQGATLMRSDIANAHGYVGDGVTIGILSDSFNTSSGYGVTDTALADVLSHDLSDTTTIPGGEGLKYLGELDPTMFGPGSDEGRAMAQIIHDVAPGAELCFATGYTSEVDFANNIRRLRTSSACNADVIVDDIEYEDEPFFSDGMIAQAVDEVATSTLLPGHKVSYFAAAGNDARQGYTSELNIVADAEARAIAPAAIRINLSTVPSSIDTSGGFHNFNGRRGKQLAEDIEFSDGTDMSFQWDDPFDLNPTGITTDLNLLFFDPASGNFLFAVSDDNFQTNQPLELFTLFTGNGPGTYGELLMAIARTGVGKHLAHRIKYVAFGNIIDLNGLITDSTPTVFGHNCARGANSIAASVYNTDPAFFGPPKYSPLYESYSSPGPALIAFDRDGERYPFPEVRLKPDVAGPDGVNTTFFPETELFGPYLDYEADFLEPDGYPNFFGTSAAAAHAAGVAALLVQKSGGPGSIRPPEVSAVLKASAPARDLNLFSSEAVAENNKGRVIVIARGDNSSASDFSARFFEIRFQSKVPGAILERLTVDLKGTGLLFDPTTFPVTVGSSNGPTLTSAAPAGALTSTMTLTFSGFTSGSTLTFGIARGFTLASFDYIVPLGGSSADELAGASISAVIDPPGKQSGEDHPVHGVFFNQLGYGYRIFDGFGMIDAVNALRLIPAHK